MRLGDLSGGQLHGGQGIPQVAVACQIVSGGLRYREVKPHVGLDRVFGHSHAAQTAHPHLRLAGRIPPMGRVMEPCGGQVIVFCDTLALRVEDSQQRSGIVRTLIGGLLRPAESRCVVLGQTFALVIHPRDLVLGGDVSFAGQREQFGDRFIVDASLKCKLTGLKTVVGLFP